MNSKILWSVYENGKLTGAMPWKLVRELFGERTDGVIAVRRDRWGRLVAKDPYVGEEMTFADMENLKVWTLPNLPA